MRKLLALHVVAAVGLATSASALTVVSTTSTADLDITSNDYAMALALVDGGIETVTEALGAVTTNFGGYEYSAWADTYGGNVDETFQHTLTTIFVVTPDYANSIYDISFETSRAGILGKADDTFLHSTVYSYAEVGALTGTVNSAAAAGLNLASASYDAGTGTSAVSQSSGSSTFFSGLSGETNWVVTTTWSSNVTSNYDEAGIMMGLPVSESFLGLDIFPSGNSGVFTLATATITTLGDVGGPPIPEPATGALLAFGLGMLGISRARRAGQ